MKSIWVLIDGLIKGSSQKMLLCSLANCYKKISALFLSINSRGSTIDTLSPRRTFSLSLWHKFKNKGFFLSTTINFGCKIKPQSQWVCEESPHPLLISFKKKSLFMIKEASELLLEPPTSLRLNR